MRRVMMNAVPGLCALFIACGGSPAVPDRTVRFDFDFDKAPPGWTADVAQWWVRRPPIEDVFGYRLLPAELAAGRTALYTTSGGEDLFVFCKTRVSGLRPDVTYRASFSLEIATNTASQCIGAGGPPGEGTSVKAGASAIEPIVVDVAGGHFVNISKGYGSRGGADAVYLGNIATSKICGPSAEWWWEFKQLTSQEPPLHVRPAADGSLWFLLGTDTVFFGSLRFYYTHFTATLAPE